MSTLRAWLEDLGLGEYADAFADNRIDAGVLPSLTSDDLKDIGVVAVGDRRRLLSAIAALSEVADGPAAEEAAGAGPPTRAGPGSEAERRHLTVMFCDLVGSTALSAALDPEDMRHVIRAYQNAVAGEVARFEGHVAKFMGDGVLAYFGYPKAHEDEAERAVRAGLAVVAAVGRLPAPAGEPLAARVGIATGLVVVGDLVGEGTAQEQAVVGETPNLAARLQAVAEPGQVVAGASTRSLLGDLFEVTDLGAQALKGIAAPVRAFAVLGERAVESRFAARAAGGVLPMIGRDHELALLLERWRQAKAGEGQMVLLTGEAGIGKSRIAQAMIDAVAAQAHFRVRYQCSPYHHDSALYPAIQHLGRAAGFAPDDGPEARLDKLERMLAQTGEDGSGEAAPLIAALLQLDSAARYGTLEMSPEQRRVRTLRILAAQLVGLARQMPVLFIIEDAHWIDPTTLDLVDLALDRIAEAAVLILVTARPSFEHAFGGRPIVTRLALNRLGREQISGIVARIAKGKTLPREVMDEIWSKTDGVPLFVEELTKAVLESGLLRDTGDAYDLEGTLRSLAIPSSLHDSLMARLDRLQPVKEVAQMAACIGREFDYRLLAAVSPLPEAELRDALGQLIGAELVFCRGVPPEATYAFKHALVRDAAYESLLKARRQHNHGRILEALERSGEAAPEILARHATDAGLAEKAIDYWQQAGMSALARPAYLEAIGHFGNAIQLVQAMGESRPWQERELDLQVKLGHASIASRGHGDTRTVRIFDRALRLIQAIGETPHNLSVYYGRWTAHHVRAEYPTAIERAQDLVAQVSRNGADQNVMVALRMLATSQFMMGRFVDSRESHLRAMALQDPDRDAALTVIAGQDQRVGLRAYFAFALWSLGYPDQAREMMAEALQWSQKATHLPTRAYALTHAALLGRVMGDTASAADLGREVLDLATAYGFRLWEAFALRMSANHHLERGDLDAALSLHRRAQRMLADSDARIFTCFFEPDWAQWLGDLERGDEALDIIGDARKHADRTEERWAETQIHCVQGDIHLRQSAPDQAEACYRRGLDVARRQQGRSWELRAAIRLARLLADRGDRRQAHDLLAPLHGWFTEGFDTPDLVDAAALLDALR